MNSRRLIVAPRGQSHAPHRLTAVRVLERGQRDVNCDQLFWAGMSALGPTTGLKTRKARYQQMLFRFAPDSRPTSRSQNYFRRQLFANAAIAASRVSA